MSRIRGLELQFNLQKKNLKSKEDCLITALHCLIINENHECVGTGDEWPDTDSCCTELLPENWNSNQDMYSLRYCTKDKRSRILLKATKMEHILQVDVVKNEEVHVSLPLAVNTYISDNYGEYSSAYKDLESLTDCFQNKIIECLNNPKAECSKVLQSPKAEVPNPPQPSKSLFDFEDPRDPFNPPSRNPRSGLRDPLQRNRPPRIGGSDLDPFGFSGGGGMFMDPSSFGIPLRPTYPEFGIGGPGGLPRGAVPPGARFDPFMPPIGPVRRRHPDPDHYPPPDFEDFM